MVRPQFSHSRGRLRCGVSTARYTASRSSRRARACGSRPVVWGRSSGGELHPRDRRARPRRGSAARDCPGAARLRCSTGRRATGPETGLQAENMRNADRRQPVSPTQPCYASKGPPAPAGPSACAVCGLPTDPQRALATLLLGCLPAAGVPAAPSRRVDRRVGSGPTHIKPPGGQRSVAGRVRPGIHSAPTWTSARSSGKCRVRAPACARSPR